MSEGSIIPYLNYKIAVQAKKPFLKSNAEEIATGISLITKTMDPNAPGISARDVKIACPDIFTKTGRIKKSATKSLPEYAGKTLEEVMDSLKNVLKKINPR